MIAWISEIILLGYDLLRIPSSWGDWDSFCWAERKVCVGGALKRSEKIKPWVCESFSQDTKSPSQQNSFQNFLPRTKALEHSLPVVSARGVTLAVRWHPAQPHVLMVQGVIRVDGRQEEAALASPTPTRPLPVTSLHPYQPIKFMFPQQEHKYTCRLRRHCHLHTTILTNPSTISERGTLHSHFLSSNQRVISLLAVYIQH